MVPPTFPRFERKLAIPCGVGTAVLTSPRGGARVVARFKEDIYCDGVRVWQEADTPALAGYGTDQDAPENTGVN